jgi:hypothetical protein
MVLADLGALAAGIAVSRALVQLSSTAFGQPRDSGIVDAPAGKECRRKRRAIVYAPDGDKIWVGRTEAGR